MSNVSMVHILIIVPLTTELSCESNSVSSWSKVVICVSLEGIVIADCIFLRAIDTSPNLGRLMEVSRIESLLQRAMTVLAVVLAMRCHTVRWAVEVIQSRYFFL